MIRPDRGMPALRCCCSRTAIFWRACSSDISSPWRVYGSEKESITGGIVVGVRKKEGREHQLMYWFWYLDKSSSQSWLGNSVRGCHISSIRVTVPHRISCGLGFCRPIQPIQHSTIDFRRPRTSRAESIPTGTECGSKRTGSFSLSSFIVHVLCVS